MPISVEELSLYEGELLHRRVWKAEPRSAAVIATDGVAIVAPAFAEVRHPCYRLMSCVTETYTPRLADKTAELGLQQPAFTDVADALCRSHVCCHQVAAVYVRLPY